MRPLRIAMVSETYPPEVNGVARTVGFMAEGLCERGHFVQLVRPRQSGHDHAASGPRFREILARGIPIPRYTQLKVGLPAKGPLVRAWSELRPDIVHIATEGPLGWSALAAARKLGIPVATDFHTNFHAYSRHYGFAWLAAPVMAYLKRFHNRADCTMVPTAELADELGERGYRGLRVVGRGVNPEVFTPQRRSAELRARWGADEDTPVALCVSRFAPAPGAPPLGPARSVRRRRGLHRRGTAHGAGHEPGAPPRRGRAPRRAIAHLGAHRGRLRAGARRCRALKSRCASSCAGTAPSASGSTRGCATRFWCAPYRASRGSATASSGTS